MGLLFTNPTNWNSVSFEEGRVYVKVDTNKSVCYTSMISVCKYPNTLDLNLHESVQGDSSTILFKSTFVSCRL